MYFFNKTNEYRYLKMWNNISSQLCLLYPILRFWLISIVICITAVGAFLSPPLILMLHCRSYSPEEVIVIPPPARINICLQFHSIGRAINERSFKCLRLRVLKIWLTDFRKVIFSTLFYTISDFLATMIMKPFQI